MLQFFVYVVLGTLGVFVTLFGVGMVLRVVGYFQERRRLRKAIDSWGDAMVKRGAIQSFYKE